MTEKTLPATGLYLDDLVSTGKPSLGDLHTVSWIVRHFAKFVFDRRAAFLAGEPGAEDPLPAIEAEARLLGDIILGRDDRFDAQPWNTPNRLGNVLKVLLPEEDEHYGDPGAALFMWVAYQLSEMSHVIEQGGSESETRTAIDDMLNDVTARLLGIKY